MFATIIKLFFIFLKRFRRFLYINTFEHKMSLIKILNKSSKIIYCGCQYEENRFIIKISSRIILKALSLICQHYVRFAVYWRREINISRRYQKFTLNQPPPGVGNNYTPDELSQVSKCAYIIIFYLLLEIKRCRSYEAWFGARLGIIANYSRAIKRKLYRVHVP